MHDFQSTKTGDQCTSLECPEYLFLRICIPDIIMKVILFLLSAVSVVLSQRPGYAGKIPYGYPVIEETAAPPAAAPAATGQDLSDR
jgi:hypothetical protein